jgi:DNA ligase (NAD+)
MCPTQGCTANVYKANAIIPQILSFEEDGLSQIDVYPIPKKCPICGDKTAIIKEKDTEILVCTNSSCKGKLLGKMAHFVSKNAMNIEGLSEETLSKFIDLGWLKQFEDIFKLPMRKEIMELDGFGKKSYDKLCDAIEKSRNTTLQRLIYSLSIPYVGKDASKKISQKCKSDLEAFKYLISNKYKWSEIEGIGDVINKSIQEYFADFDNKVSFMSLVENYITFENETEIKVNNKSLNGLIFVITGSVEHYKNRDELKVDIENHNGKVAGSISSKTNYLINNDNKSQSGKNKKAKELNIPIISEEQFIEMIK